MLLKRIHKVAALEYALAAQDGPVMLDFYADWCVSCKEMEWIPFSRPEAEARMKGGAAVAGRRDRTQRAAPR